MLTPDNAIDYLRRRDWPLAPNARAEVLAGGVSNMVLRVVNGAELLVLKQSRPQLRTQDAWFSDVERIFRELEVMQALEPLLPAGTVPKVLFADRPNFIYAMSHAPEDARVWKSELLEGRIDPQRGEQAGRVLGIMHETSARDAAFQAFVDHQVYVQLRVDPFYRRVQERRPEVAEPVAAIIERMLTSRHALCHGDYTPKNILLHGDGFTLVDYETAHFGEPTMDLGLFLAHLTLKALRRPDARRRFFEVMRAFWDAYGSCVHFRPIQELEAYGLQHLGVCLLARIDGTSPVDYLPEPEKRETVRRLGRALLREELRSWQAAWEWCDEEFGAFGESP